MRTYITFFIFFPLFLSAQNSDEFFKVIPVIDEDTPAWAVEMYKDDANVKKVIFEYDLFYSKQNFVKNIHTQNYKHWLKHVIPIMNEDGIIIQKSQKEERRYFDTLKSKRKSNSKTQSIWTSIGPFETYKNGTTTPYSNHANVYSIDQSKTNGNILIAGTESGGVFKTVDKAANWSLISLDEEFSNGITAVKIHPTNSNTYLIGGNNRIYKTTDGGTSWNEVLYIDGSANEIVFDPSDQNHIFTTTSKGLFESTDGGNNWTQVYTEQCWDINFHPTNSNIVYLLKSNSSLKKTEFYKSITGGASWTLMSTGWYNPQNSNEASESGGKIAVSPNDPNRVYVALIGASKSGDDGWIGLYRSNNSGTNWYLPSGQIGGPYQNPNTMPWNPAAYTSGYHQGYYNFDLEASESDADLLWFGTVRLNESSDGGVSYTAIGGANNIRLSDVHADIQDIEVIGNDIWVASDGGINYSNDQLNSHASMKYGIIGSNFWGFGSGWNEDVYVGGKYHNGNTAYYQTYGTGYSHNVGGVEESTGYVNPLNNRDCYFNEYWAGGIKKKRIADALGGSFTTLATFSLIPNESYVESSSSGYFFDPRYADHIYAGRDSVIYKSTNGGAVFTPLYDFGVTGNVFEIEISRTNPDVMYAVFQPGAGYWDWCEIHKTTNGGTSWTKLTDVPSNSRWRLEMTLNPENSDEIWVSANSGNNGQKIYASTDGGTTWVNKTNALLDGESIKDIYYHGGSGGYVYALSRTGFFYYNPSTNDWIDYSDGLPLITNGFRIAPFYRDNKIRFASNGRGVWEAPLPASTTPIAQIITSSDSVFCSRDTVSFDCYSIVEHNGTTWNWVISPSPQYISSTTVRNPKVVFGTDGAYDVTLTITNSNGSDSYTKAQMVNIESSCDAEPIPGFSMSCTNSNDYAQIPDMGISTNTFTISAWIKPDGIQPEYSGIVMNDGDAAGLNFREANNTLAYHWPGGQWWWDSNLTVPDGEWSYVALVAEPNALTVYVNGESATHVTNLNVVDISTLKIGSYKGWTSRNYKGEIDEVTIWNRSLSEDEIRLHRHITKENVVDPQLLSYYQFNSESAQVLDRVGLNHAILNGTATKIMSDAPIGGGTSDIQDISSSGITSFGNTGVEIDFASNNPNGKIVVSRLDLLPNLTPGSNQDLEQYWIINNYGNSNFGNINHIYFDPYNADPDAAANTNNIFLYRRQKSNEHLNTWQSICNAASINGTQYDFDNACGLNSFSQFYISDPCIGHRSLTNDFLSGDIEDIQSSNSINANNLLNAGSDIIYQSQSIELENDFEVKIGAMFHAFIGGCTN